MNAQMLFDTVEALSGAGTSIQTLYIPADDFTDPAAVHTFSHLSASIMLSRKRARRTVSGGRSTAVELEDGSL